MKDFLGNPPQPLLEDEDKAARRVAEAEQLVKQKETELAEAKAWLFKTRLWLAAWQKGGD